VFLQRMSAIDSSCSSSLFAPPILAGHCRPLLNSRVGRDFKAHVVSRTLEGLVVHSALSMSTEFYRSHSKRWVRRCPRRGRYKDLSAVTLRGRIDPLATPQRMTALCDGWSRRRADVAEHALGRLNWADSALTGCTAGRIEVRAKAAIQLQQAAGVLLRCPRCLVGLRPAGRRIIGRAG
jgi:hypothetical protein